MEDRLKQIENTANKKYINKIVKELRNIEGLHVEKEIPLDTFNPDYIFYPYYSGIECIDANYVINEIYPQYKTRIFQLPRFEGDRQWMFTVPPKFLNSKTQNKNVLIIDDGSSTGETIIQMIDEICFLDVKKIVVLSIIGKLDDYKREFLSRIKEIKVKKFDSALLQSQKGIFDEHIVPIHFYLATNLHIPVYSHFNENIFVKEINTLKRFKQLSNLPFNVLLYINYRISELTIDNEKNQVPQHFGESYDLLNLFKLRDAIGKINGYKFYKEYFDFFDDLIESVKIHEDYKSIEDIISIIIHERRLIITIKNLLPDLFLILSNYIQDIIIIKKRKSVSLSEYSSLRFYFIINYYEFFDTITEQSIHTFLNFIKECKPPEPFNFFIYILFTSFSLERNEVFIAIEGILNSDDIPKKYFSGLKSLYNYYRINHYTEGALDPSDELRSIYTYELDVENHQKTLSTYLANFRNKLLAYTTASVKDKNQRLLEAKDFWDNYIYERLISIINNAKKIGSILESYNDSKLANIIYKHEDYNAEKVFYSIDDLLSSIRFRLPTDDRIHEIRNSIDKLLIRRITKTGENPLCSFAISYKRINYFDLWNEIQFSSEYNLVKKTGSDFNSKYCIIKIHECIIKGIIFHEIIKNLRLSDSSSAIYYYWRIIEHKAVLRVENKVDKEKELERTGRLNGLSDMKEISKHYEIDVEHSNFSESNDLFYIEIKFPYSKK